MRRLFVVGMMVVLMLALASPAFAQAVVVDGDELSVQFLDASQVQQAAQIQTGDANAAADDGSAAFAYNSLGIYLYQFNGGF